MLSSAPAFRSACARHKERSMLAETSIRLSDDITARVLSRTQEAAETSGRNDQVSAGGTDATAFDIWECSIHLARYLLRNSSLVVGEHKVHSFCSFISQRE